MKRRVLAVFCSIFAGVSTPAAPIGKITAPEPGSCLGPDELPVSIVDDFGADPGLTRTYEPRGGMIKLTDGIGGARFGSSVALDDDVLAIGAEWDDEAGEDAGAAYVARLVDGRWAIEQKLLPPGAADGARFGAVDVDGGRLAVGAPLHGDPKTGAVFLYVHDGTRWVLRQQLNASDAARVDRFGSSVALQDATLVVGAIRADGREFSTGAVYVFERDDERWVERQKLFASDGETSDEFGYAADLDGDTVVVGAPLDDDHGAHSGSTYVFRRGPNGFVHEAKLIGSAVRPFSRYGRTLSLDGDTLLVGSSGGFPSGNTGSAYVFERLGSVWSLRWRLRHSTANPDDGYGHGVALSGNRLIVGAPGDDGAEPRTGTAHLYHRVPAGWFWDGRRYAHDGERSAGLGWQLDVRDDLLVMGAARGAGAVYLDGAIPPSAYAVGGNYDVRLTVTDAAGGSTDDRIDFTIDPWPPRVTISYRAGNLVVPTTIPFAQLFHADDIDRAEGGVDHERLLLDDCVVFDGSSYGNGDGLLSDEIMRLDEESMCEAILRCGLPGFFQPELRIEVADCGGNVGQASRSYALEPTITRENCE